MEDEKISVEDAARRFDDQFNPEPEPVGPVLDLYVIAAVLVAIIVGAIVALSGCASGHNNWDAITEAAGDVIRGN